MRTTLDNTVYEVLPRIWTVCPPSCVKVTNMVDAIVRELSYINHGDACFCAVITIAAEREVDSYGETAPGGELG